MIEVKILKDSINPWGVRLTTWIVTYPRFIHADFLRHRRFSRCAASSRAIPISKMLEAVIRTPAVPEFWGRNQSGMSAAGEISGASKWLAQKLWLAARWPVVGFVWLMLKLKLHKQIPNRMLEPWMHITETITATSHDNFFALRAEKGAQPELQVVAYRMLAKYLDSAPQSLRWGDWHIPYSSGTTRADLPVGVAHAARTSYTNHEKSTTWKEDRDRHDQLAYLAHWSPFEHCAQACPMQYHYSNFDSFDGPQPDPSGWEQYRKEFKGEEKLNVDLEEIMRNKPDWITL